LAIGREHSLVSEFPSNTADEENLTSTERPHPRFFALENTFPLFPPSDVEILSIKKKPVLNGVFCETDSTTCYYPSGALEGHSSEIPAGKPLFLELLGRN